MLNEKPDPPIRQPISPRYRPLLFVGLGGMVVGALIYFSDRHVNATTDPIGIIFTVSGLVLVVAAWVVQRHWRDARHTEALRADDAYLERRDGAMGSAANPSTDRTAS